MDDEECQPDYCDCDGFHTGACRERYRKRQMEEIIKALDSAFKEAYYRSIYNRLAEKYEHTPESH